MLCDGSNLIDHGYSWPALAIDGDMLEGAGMNS
jgi:hypothetical protein